MTQAPAGPIRRGLAAARDLLDAVLFFGLFALFAAGCLAWSLPAGLLYHVLPREAGARLGQFAIMAGFRWYVGAMQATGRVRCDLTALDALRDAGPLVIAPNHPSLLDVVLIVSRLPRVVCIAKPAIWDNPLLGGGARLAAYVRNDAPHMLIRRAAEAVARGRQLLVFPEGTRTVHPPIDPFKGGFALVARRAGAPVQTVFIESNTDFLGKGRPLFKRPRFPLIYRVRLGRRFEVHGNAQAFADELEAYFRAELAHAEPGRRDPA